MRSVLVLGVCALVASVGHAGAQDAEPRTVTTRLRHVSTVVLPVSDTIVEVVAGDAEYWDVSSAAHLAFIRPLMEGAESNLVILTGRGAVIPLVVVERAAGAVDAVVRLGATEAAGPGPVLAPVATVAAAVRASAEAWAAVVAAEAGAAARVDAARLATQAERDASREAYPRRLQFAYAFDREPREAPFFVEGMWHDGERTYLRTRATSAVLYEVAEGSGTVDVVTVEDRVGSVYVLPRVLGPGFLDVDGARLAWSMATRRTGP